MQNNILQLLQPHGFIVGVRVLNWPACSPDRSPIENICHIIQLKMSKMSTDSSENGNLYQARLGPNSKTKTPETHNLDAQMSSNCFEKNRRCYTMVNIPSPILRPLAGIKFEMISFCAYNCKNKICLNVLCYVNYVLLWINIGSCDLKVF